MKSARRHIDERAAPLEQGGHEVGPLSPEMVAQRARELAEIDGRSSVGEADRQQALLELRGETGQFTSKNAESDYFATSNPADMAVKRGEQIPDIRPPDEQLNAEQETSEGIREAEHERMLQARQNEATEES